VLDASVLLLAGVVAIAFFGGIPVDRVHLATVFVLGSVLLVAGRSGWRRWLTRRRRAGEFISRALIVGSPASARELVRQLQSTPQAGYAAVGVCVPNPDPRQNVSIEDVP